MRETLHWSVILGNPLICNSLWDFFRYSYFLLSYCGFFLVKIAKKIHPKRPNTMKETLHSPGMLGKLFL